MTFYHLDGARGFSVRYDAYYPQRKLSWSYVLAAVLIASLLSVSLVASKLYASVEQVEPRMLASVPAPTYPAVLAASAGEQSEPDKSADLEEALNTWAAAQPGSEWSFHVSSLDDDQLRTEINGGQQFSLASIYKLFLLKPLAQKIPAEAWGNTNVTERTYAECVHAMLNVSDNPCAEAIGNKLGWSALQRQNQALGYKKTVLNREDFLAGTASDTALLLDRLYHGDGYDAKTKELVLAAMGSTKGAQAIRKACGGCTVFNKTGNLGDAKNDAAIVKKDGKSYVVVIFSKNASWDQMTRAAAVIAQRL